MKRSHGGGSRRLPSAGKDGAGKVWDVNTGQEVLTLAGFQLGVSGVAFSPDGKQLAAAGGSFDRGEVKLWDATIGWQIASRRK